MNSCEEGGTRQSAALLRVGYVAGAEGPFGVSALGGQEGCQVLAGDEGARLGVQVVSEAHLAPSLPP